MPHSCIALGGFWGQLGHGWSTRRPVFGFMCALTRFKEGDKCSAASAPSSKFQVPRIDAHTGPHNPHLFGTFPVPTSSVTLPIMYRGVGSKTASNDSGAPKPYQTGKVPTGRYVEYLGKSAAAGGPSSNQHTMLKWDFDTYPDHGVPGRPAREAKLQGETQCRRRAAPTAVLPMLGDRGGISALCTRTRRFELIITHHHSYQSWPRPALRPPPDARNLMPAT
jgi:hypothetical protein